MTTAVADPTTTHTCLACTSEDDHPKIHILVGRSIFDPAGPPKWASLHHDCLSDTSDTVPAPVARWRVEHIDNDSTSEGEKLRAIIARNEGGTKGNALRQYILESVPLLGNGPTMASGMAVVQAEAIVTATHINSSTATVGTITITGPINVRAMATAPTSDNNAGTEITTGGSYTSGGTGLGALTFGSVSIVSNLASITTTAALNKTGMPVCTILALAEYDSSATKLPTWWGTVTSLTTNSGDTVSIAIGGLVDTLG